MERYRSDLYATDIINLSLTCQLENPVRVQLPMHIQTDDPDDIVVYGIPAEESLENDSRWATLDTYVRIRNNCITFSINKCCM